MRKLLLALLASLSWMAWAQESEERAFIYVEIDDGSLTPLILADGGGSTLGTDIKVKPSNTTGDPSVREVNRLDLRFGCRLPGGYLLDCVVTLAVQARPGSGGHDHHDAQRPIGRFSRLSGTVDPNTGTLATTFTAPEISGIIDIHAEGFHPFIRVNPADFTLGVGTEGFVELPDSPNYRKIGVTASHTRNHFGLPALTTRLEELAVSYLDANLQVAPLEYNDMSLEFGGLFDIRATWAPNHKAHRKGTNVDLRTNTIPVSIRGEVKLLAGRLGFAVFDETDTTSPHFHLTLVQ